MNIFAQIIKKGLTFTTPRGKALPQDLYQLPLTGNNGFNLDTISRDLLKTVRETEEESLVSSPDSKVDTNDELRIEVLKFIIADKQEEKAAREDAAKKQLRKQQLQQLIAEKQVEADKDTSMEELMKELSELD